MASHTATVEIFYSGVWNAAPLYSRDPITITRDEQAEFITSRAALTLNDRSRIYNPRNPLSPLYGLAGRNTPIRITIDSGLRFYGEIAAWRPRRTVDFDPVTGKGDAWCEIEAAGETRRHGQGTPPSRSPMRRTLAASGPAVYWPCEDGTAAGWAASAFPGHSPLTVDGPAQFKPESDYVRTLPGIKFGTAALIDLAGGASLTAPVPAAVTAATATGFVAYLVLDFDPATISGDLIVIDIGTASGERWRLTFTTGLNTWVSWVDSAGVATPAIAVGSVQSTFSGVDFAVWQDGANTRVGLNYDPATGTYVATGLVAVTMAGVTEIKVNPTKVTQGTPLPVGHLTVWAGEPMPLEPRNAELSYATALPAENADARLTRLCTEDGVPLVIPAVSAGFETPMGNQPVGTFLDLLREIERTEDGLLYEPRDAAGLAYRPRPDLYNQTPALALNFAVPNQIAAPLEPAVDDVGIRNDITVKRTGGSSARAVLEAGPMSVQPPPAGVGRVGTQVEVNTADDTRLADFAGWHLRKGTVDATRYERVTVDLDANPGLAAAASAVDIGDIITIANTEEGGATLLVLGYTETIGSHRRKITYNTTPYAPWLWLTDTFTRTVGGGWGTADSGHVWTTTGGSASDYSVSSGIGRQTNGTVGVLRHALLDVGRTNARIRVGVRIDTGAVTGASATAFVAARAADASNYYAAAVAFTTADLITLAIIKRVAGSLSGITSTTTILSGFGAGTNVVVDLDILGSTIRAKAWVPASQSEPADYQLTVTDTSLTTGTKIGCLSRLEGGNTNGAVQFQWDDLAEVRF